VFSVVSGLVVNGGEPPDDYRSARDGRRLVHAIRRLAPTLALAALCLASGAEADSLSAGKRAFERQDYVRAAPLLLVAAERRSPVAQTYLGYMYQYGLGVPRDYILASSWLHQAAEQGEPTGQFLPPSRPLAHRENLFGRQRQEPVKGAVDARDRRGQNLRS